MDDFAQSLATVEEAVHVYQEVRTTLQEGGFSLQKCICNNELVTRIISEQDRSQAKSKTFEAEPHTFFLGMQWNVDNDTLEVCRGAEKEVLYKITQWAVLSFVASVCDPVRLFAPLAMSKRILLKTISAKHRQECYDKIDNEGEERFLDLVGELAELKSMPLARRYYDRGYKYLDLHISSVASLELVCIVACLRAEDGDGVKLSLGSAELPPMKQQTIPKLELQSALYSERLKQLITENHDIQVPTVTHWTDSTTVFQWLHSAHKRQQVFVANRVWEILDRSTVN